MACEINTNAGECIDHNNFWATTTDVDIFTSTHHAPTSSLQAGAGYEDLPRNWIRLLRILPCAPNSSTAELQCKLVQVALGAAPSYTALSYTWGSPPDIHEIYINGRRTRVRKNLWRFLREARNLDLEIFDWLWIDALCIDQDNHEERGIQVALMSEIYASAKQVLIWLGPAYAGSDQAMAEIAQRAAQKSAKNNLRSMAGKNVSLSLSLLCTRVYWTRLWIFQEVLLAKNLLLMCGARTAPWESLRKMILDVHNLCEEHQHNASAVRLVTSMQYQIIYGSPAKAIVLGTDDTVHGTSLYKLLRSTASLHCANPLDRVYALLGVARGGSLLKPDYDISIGTLLNAVLKHHHEVVEPPRDLKTVERQCHVLTTVQGLRPDAISMLEINDPVSSVSAQSGDITRYPLGLEGSFVGLWWAVAKGHNAVERLILEDPNVSLHSWLERAVVGGSEATVRFLLSKKVFLSETYVYALQLASIRGHSRLIEVLLNDRSIAQDCWTQTVKDQALRHAAHGGHIEAVKSLLHRGARVQLSDCERLAEGSVTENAFDDAVARGHVEVVKLLFDQHETLRPDFLCIAAARGHLQVVRLLLQKGVDVNASETFWPKHTALYIAVRAGHVAVVAELLASGATLDAMASWQLGGSISCDDALSAAQRRSYTAVVELLIKHGAISSDPKERAQFFA
ncbi:hypothetical protein AMS68_007212 [Peltaster fructicola]|uniref:Heterokaryon incompatibility domain-containing protein n=1 Tax=Peltaster fructicola TaxID=286661 RepID=A0A6H0Y442_9PEZI|nr:hypothetical protein AMS68_007212 [Peltaster fructicola]